MIHARFRARPRRAALLALAALLTAGCHGAAAAQAPAVTTVPDSSAWHALVDEYVEAYFKAHPDYAAIAGRHEFDGGLPDWSAAGIRAESARLKAFRKRIVAVPEAALSVAQRFERRYLLARIDGELFWVDTAEAPFRNPAFYISGSDTLDPAVYLTRPYGTALQRLKAYIRYLESVARVAPSIRANLRTPMPASYVKLGVAGFGGFADFYLGDAARAFAGVGDAALQAELHTKSVAAARAMRALADWLQAGSARATGPQPLGATRFAAMLKSTEAVDMPIAELEAAGRADLARNTAALGAACGEFAPGASLRDCVARQQALKPTGDVVAAARVQLEQLRQFIIDKKVVTIPGPEQALVQESPPYNRQNFAYIDVPGPYDRALPSVYNISPPDPSWSKADQAAYIPARANLLFTSAHEVWPGHFLQFNYANRATSRIGSLFVGYAFAEGWAHYAEEMMWDRGLGGDAEAHIGEILQALLRDARFLSAIGIHTHGMSVAESEALFRDQAFQDPGNARQQAARGVYDPGYINYTLGKLMIRKLRDDWCASRGGVAAWQAFHDEFLSHGGPPIPLLRQLMLPGDTGALL